MKISTKPTTIQNLMAAVIAVILFASSIQANELYPRPLTPQEIHDNHLAEGTIPSGGLLTVGIGEPVYLEALVDKDLTVSGAVWTLTEKPSGSAAVIDASPIPMEMPIYSVRRREDYQVADRMMLVPDVEGVYMVDVSVNTSEGAVVLGTQVTGAVYVGSGVVVDRFGEPDPEWGGPDYPQCALCHQWDPDGKVASYSMTGHATFFQNAIDGLASDHYGSYCMDCHVLGGHGSAIENGSFDNVAEHVGWTFPEVLEPGNWDAMPMELKEKASIQCEHCHGAGSEHHGILDTISVSLDAGDCGQCHDEEPYHNRNRQWENSGHARPPARASGSCAVCHTGDGFINAMHGEDVVAKVDEAITCAACHDPHSNEMDNHQLRNTAMVTLENGVEVTEGGNGLMCMNCHKARRNAEEYVTGSVSSHYGPHYGIQGDLFLGTNAIEYDMVQGKPSIHLQLLENGCATCHMQVIPRDDALYELAGDHSFNMSHDGVDVTNVCQDCHGEVDSFDMPVADFNYDFKVEGIQTEVHHLLEALAMQLHPVGSPEVIRGDSDHTYSDKEKKALYNYMCVEEDHSFGIHNPEYITGILMASINDMADPSNSILGGTNVPMGGEWFYSSWFNYYRPLSVDGWVDHVYLGMIYVEGDADKVLIWDHKMQKWFWTNADVYPVMYDVEDGTWMYFQGLYGNMRHFYSFGSGEWISSAL